MHGGGAPADPLAVLGYLTDRDRWLLDVLAEHQVLTTGQLTALAFPRSDVAQRRLLKLARLGVLDRFRWHVPRGSQSWHYTLGIVGETLVAAARGVEAPRPAQHRARIIRLATNPRLPHLLGVNELFTSLAAHARTHPGTGLDAWWSEQHCARRCAPFAHPDGYGRWTDGTRSLRFFLEYDTGTEPLTRVTAKLPGYADLATAGGPSCPVLLWLPTARREANLHAALAAPPPNVTVVTTSAELADALGCGPAGPIWLAHAGQHRRSLADLGPMRAGGHDRATAANTGPDVADDW
ncbi:MAG: replication-relaxation family protein [Actinomycetes bacterium]